MPADQPRAEEVAIQEVVDATGLTRVGAAFMLGRSGGDVTAAVAEFWLMEADDE